MRRYPCLLLAGLIILATGQTASADIVATLSFTQPTGTARLTDPIPVYVTLLLDPSSDPIIIDGSGNVTSLTAGQVNSNLLPLGPGGTQKLFANMTNSNTNDWFGVSGSFFDGAYNFNFVQGFAFLSNTTFLPGSSTDFLLGSFWPIGGIAPPGTYTFDSASFFIQVFDNASNDAVRNPVSGDPNSPYHIADVPVAATTSSLSRDVVGPEPGTSVLLLGGAVLLAGVARRRARKLC